MTRIVLTTQRAVHKIVLRPRDGQWLAEHHVYCLKNPVISKITSAQAEVIRLSERLDFLRATAAKIGRLSDFADREYQRVVEELSKLPPLPGGIGVREWLDTLLANEREKRKKKPKPE